MTHVTFAIIKSLCKMSAARLRTRRTLSIWLLFSSAATIMAPFHSSEIFTWPWLGIYWSVVVGLAMVFSAVISEVIALRFSDRLDWRFELMRMAGMCLLFTPALYGWTLWLTRMPGVIPNVWVMAIFVALTGIIVHALRRILRAEAAAFLNDDDGAGTLQPSAELDPTPRLMRRLPDGAEGPILRLSARDHFVDVHLPAETHTLRMRFTDAIDEMDGVPGDCAHRSHWVTFEAVTGVKRDGGRIYLIINNGDEVPVSRTYRSRMEDAGFL
ncbi:MAG: LytTR family DNA-binding domain-containing protein [Thalassovita sp.]